MFGPPGPTGIGERAVSFREARNRSAPRMPVWLAAAVVPFEGVADYKHTFTGAPGAARNWLQSTQN